MKDTVNELLEHLNLDRNLEYTVTLTTLYLPSELYIISLIANGINIRTPSHNQNIPGMYEYALLSKILNDKSIIESNVNKSIADLLEQALGLSDMNPHAMFDKDGYSVEVKHRNRTYRIDSKAQKIYEHTPNQWLEQTYTQDLEYYFNRIRGGIILLDKK